MVLAKRLEVDRMNDAKREAFLEAWSKDNKGQCFNYFPALPYHHTVTDMLHLNLNQWNDAISEAFHSHLVESEYTDVDLKQMVRVVVDQFNARTKQASLGLTVGESVKGKPLNGPKLKELLRAGTLLQDLVDIMKPLWHLREAKDHPAVRPHALSANELAAEAAAEAQCKASEKAGAGAGAKAGRQAKGAGGRPKKKRGRSAATARRPMVVNADDHAGDSSDKEGSVGNAGGAGDARSTGDASSPVTYATRVSVMFHALLELWTFTHQHQLDTSLIVGDLRHKRAWVAGKLGRAVEEAMLECMGTKRRRTYGHDTVYGIPHLYMLLGKPYLGATEGNEHAHQDMKKYFKKMSSHSSRRLPDVQQTQKLMLQKQQVCTAMACSIKRTAKTQMYTGMLKRARREAVQREEEEKEEDLPPPALRDDALEATKFALVCKNPGMRVCKADESLLDPDTQAKLRHARAATGKDSEGEEGVEV